MTDTDDLDPELTVTIDVVAAGRKGTASQIRRAAEMFAALPAGDRATLAALTEASQGGDRAARRAARDFCEERGFSRRAAQLLRVVPVA